MIFTSPSSSPSSKTLSLASETAPLVTTPSHTHPQVLVKKSWQRYGLALLPTSIVLFSFTFYAIVSQKGGISASRSMSKMVIANPRVSAQVVAALGTSLTLAVKWGLSRMFTIVAQKRLLEFRSLYEVEFWSSLKRGGVLWSTKKCWMRWSATAAMVIVATFYGLLTSGFVSLLSPLSIRMAEGIQGDSELDYSVPSCSAWLQRSVMAQDDWDEDCRRWFHYKSYSFQRCETTNQLYDVLDAGRASMLAYALSATPHPDPQAHISILNRMEGTRILGSTGGVIPMGPSGIPSFSVRGFSSHSEDILRFRAQSSYTLTLQGIWADVSCRYVDLSSFVWDQRILNNTCSMTPETILDTPTTDGDIFLDHCAHQDRKTWVYYLRSKNQDELLGNPFGGIGRMACEVEPRLRAIEATYKPDPGAFVMKPLEESLTPPLVVFTHATNYTKKTMIQQSYKGNLAGSMINLVAVSRLGVSGLKKDEIYPPLVASMIKGVYEYQASHLRLVLSTVFSNSTPPECYSPVKGTVSYPGIGWEARTTTLLGLFPLAVLGTLIVSLAVWQGLVHREHLKVFDPTNTLSLMVAASAGGIRFDSKVVGHPDDEDIREKMVKYTLLPDTSVYQWGLVDDTTISEVKSGGSPLSLSGDPEHRWDIGQDPKAG